MKRLTVLLTGMSLLVFAPPSYASDHLFTAVGAGGLTAPAPGVTPSQPFQNGTNNPGIPGTSVPGEGSPLSGLENTVPATDTQTSAPTITLPQALNGKMAPSSNASIP